MRADVTGCAGDGLVVTGDHVTLDLNGHTVSGDGVPNADGFDVGLRVIGTDVRVRDGSVAAFDRGLLDGGGNKAAGNGNPLQCLNIVCL